MFTTVQDHFDTNWEIFTIKDQTVYDTAIEVSEVLPTESVRNIALATSPYEVANGTGYGYSNFTRGPTEQEAFDDWLNVWNANTKLVKRTLNNWNIPQITQNRFDAMLLLQWVNKTLFTVDGSQGTYDLKYAFVNKQWNDVASMMNLSLRNKILCSRAASIFRLVDYGKPKSRKILRTEGIHKMRSQNQIGGLDSLQLKLIRFAYFAEVKDFLPYTPESLKRDIVNKYKDTLIQKQFTYSGTNTFTLQKTPSMTPVEKLQVKVNGSIVQHFFDFTLQDNVLTMVKTLNTDDIIDTTIKI